MKNFKNKIPNEAIKNVVVPRGKIPTDKIKRKIPPNKKWEFGFSNWVQKDYFGLDYQKVSVEWFVGLVERFRDLGTKNLEDFMLNSQAKESYRIHPIQWKSSVLNREDFFSLISEEYRSEETDIIQFQLTASKGRVVGYFDSTHTFQIVLLDPAHNIQLTRKNDYAAVNTKELPNDYTKIVNKFISIEKRLNTMTFENFESVKEDIQKILKDQGFCAQNRFVEINQGSFDDLNYILQMDPSFENLDFLIMCSIEIHKNSLQLNLENNKQGSIIPFQAPSSDH